MPTHITHTVLLTRQEVAERLAISPRQVAYLTSAGYLPSLKIGASRRWPAGAVERFIADRLVDAAAS